MTEAYISVARKRRGVLSTTRASKTASIAMTAARIHRCSHNMDAHTAALSDHLRGDSDDDDDGADEDDAQTTDQTQPQDAAVTSEL